MIISKVHNLEDVKKITLKQFIQSLSPEMHEDDVEHYAEQFGNVLNGEEIVTNDQTLVEIYQIFNECIYVVNQNTIRLRCNGLIADIWVDLEEEETTA